MYTWGWKECVPCGKVFGDCPTGGSLEKDSVEKQSSAFTEQVSPQGSKNASGILKLIAMDLEFLGRTLRVLPVRVDTVPQLQLQATFHVIASYFGAEVCEWNTPTPTIWQEHIHHLSTASNEPKTSEFSFFKKLKQDVCRSSCQKTLNRESIPMRDIKPSNPSRDSVKSKKDVRSSQYAKKSTTGEFGSFLNPPKGVALQSSAMPSKEIDGERFKCSPLVKTPPSCSLDLFLSKTANASVNPENQQKDGDIFSSKRLKIQQRIAKTLFPDANEVQRS